MSKIVHEPINFKKWAIFCLDDDHNNAKLIENKFYELSSNNQMNIIVEFADIVLLPNKATVKDFEISLKNYFAKYVSALVQQKQQKLQDNDLYFFLVIIPDKLNTDTFYTTLKSKINSDSPVISQFVASKTISKKKDQIYKNILR